MRVLHVYKTYLPDNCTGVPRVIYEIAEQLQGGGVETQVLCLSDTPSDTPILTGSHITHQAKQDLFIASTGLSVSVFRRFNALIRNVDLVHYHFPWPLADLLHLTAMRKVPSIVTYHSDVVKQRVLGWLYQPLQRCFLNSVDRIVATSPQYASTSGVLRRFASKTTVIPIGIADRVPPNDVAIRSWLNRVGKDFFLFVGALRYYKGLPFLLEAARMSGLPVVVVGGGGRHLIDVPPNVVFVGAVSDEDKEALLSLCRGLILPSHLRSEAFGIALIEAARAGKPLISCEIGTGTTFVNIHGETGLVAPPADPAALAEAMIRLASAPDAAAQMGENARRRYEQLFTAGDMAQAYKALYLDVVGISTRRVD
ncbi:glycosyltransferase [Rhodopseudomonas sp. BR0C11]|uniref:glycosyltransferase n=1 Tax=Rhodopseudomonas sp. BR0C11 TaxID=2269370 RepID=UPI0013E0AE90|nr:glycosyltransferase [Rhodopseudomonas sp. BR0C11]NEV75675.1 glycosyltransferase [Rhodopseudomonas sp. BR0C11]